MTVAQVKAQIKSKNLSPLYIFTGDEIAVMNIYIKKIAEALDTNVVRAETFLEIYKKISKPSSLQEKCVYVVRDDMDIMTDEKIHKVLDNPSWKDIVILVFTTVDKRLKFAKTYKDTICEFEPLKPEILKKYIKKEIDLSDTNCQKLIDICEGSYSRILLEIDKIKKYADGVHPVKGDANPDCYFNKLLKSKAIYIPSNDTVFDWCNLVMSRKDIDKIFETAIDCADGGKKVFEMLGALYNNIKQTLQVQSCHSKDVAKITGLTGWQIQNVKSYIGNYTDGELVYAMKLIRQCEVDIKTGNIEDINTIVPYILVSIL